MEFEVGMVVTHPEYGACTVTFVGDERVGVEFPSGRHALLMKRDFAPRTDAARRESAALNTEETRPDAWPESTFVREAPETRHFMGSHWEPFVEDSAEILKRIPEFISHGRLLHGYGTFFKAPREPPESWAHGAYCGWPDHNFGVSIALHATSARLEAKSLFPFSSHGAEATVKIERVVIRESEVEAHIHGWWKDLPVTFFDTQFLTNRGWYATGESLQFILAGIAYDAKPSDVFELPFTPHPEQVAWEDELAKRRGVAPREPASSLSLRGMAWFMPVPEWDVDDYSFRGPVKSVKDVDGFMGQRCWRVRVTVQRSGDEEMDVDVFVTARAWHGGEPPLVGQDIEGHFWLQGHLWTA